MSAALSATTTAGLRILALTLWGEGEGRAVRGLEGIAAVVMTRDRLAALPGGPVHFGRGIAAICRQPFQFPCWNPRGARLGEMREALARPDAQFAICLRIAGRALAGALPDPTGGATHYHRAETLPRWAIGLVPTAELGGLVFYRPLG